MQLKDVPRIRTRQDPQEAERMLQAYSRRKRFRNDHVFEDTGRANRFGVYWLRPTKLAAAYAEKCYRAHLESRGITPDGEQIGDFDGILYWTSEDPEAIPEWFKRSQAQIDAGKVLASKSHGEEHRFKAKNTGSGGSKRLPGPSEPQEAINGP